MGEKIKESILRLLIWLILLLIFAFSVHEGLWSWFLWAGKALGEAAFVILALALIGNVLRYLLNVIWTVVYVSKKFRSIKR